jgi:hypothetical protein
MSLGRKKPPAQGSLPKDTRPDLTGATAQIQQTGTYRDPVQARLGEARKAVVDTGYGLRRRWMHKAEIVLAADVRHFAQNLPAPTIRLICQDMQVYQVTPTVVR